MFCRDRAVAGSAVGCAFLQQGLCSHFAFLQHLAQRGPAYSTVCQILLADANTREIQISVFLTRS